MVGRYRSGSGRSATFQCTKAAPAQALARVGIVTRQTIAHGAVVSARPSAENAGVRRACVTGLVLLSLTSACERGGQSTAPSADPCADFEVEVEKFWSASIKAQVMDKSGAIEVDRRAGVTNKMDRISEDWVMMRTSVCKDHFVRGMIDKGQYAARVQCFDDRLDRQRTLATALVEPEGGTDLAAIDGALDELLAAPKSCESPGQ
jgi:hypothetical protein